MIQVDTFKIIQFNQQQLNKISTKLILLVIYSKVTVFKKYKLKEVEKNLQSIPLQTALITRLHTCNPFSRTQLKIHLPRVDPTIL